MRDRVQRLSGGAVVAVGAAALMVRLGAGVLSAPIGIVDCATQVCPFNSWLTAWLVFGCFC